MRIAKYLLVAVVLSFGGVVSTPRNAAADIYDRCMSMGISWAMSQYWGQVGPGVIIRAARGACARYLPMA